MKFSRFSDLVRNQYQQQDDHQRRKIFGQNENEDLGVNPELLPFLHDNESNNSDINDISSIYSADISLEDYESNNSEISSIYSDISLTSSQESNDDFQSDLEESISNISINEDAINDSNKSMDFGKFF